MFWRKKVPIVQLSPALVDNDVIISDSKKAGWLWLYNNLVGQQKEIIEPITFASMRLNSKAADVGSEKAIKAYNEHKTRIRNQWVNPFTSVNSGYGTAQMAYFLYQTVNYFECYALAQDSMFQRVFDILSNYPVAKRGELVNNSVVKLDEIEKAARKYKVWEHITKALRSNAVAGGCLIYMDFGLSGMDLENPLDLSKTNMNKFKGFIHIDPVNLTPITVNSNNPTAPDYMNPTTYYCIGLGTVHSSHFLKFEDNIPELVMRPLTMYFGMPLTQLIKQDIANSNMASQGIANLINRFRYTFLKTNYRNFSTDNASEFKERLQAESYLKDNFAISPLLQDEEITQFTTSLAGMSDNIETFYRIIAAKTSIPPTMLIGDNAAGLSDSQSGYRRNFYDMCRTKQELIKPNLLKMYGIVTGTITGSYVIFDDYEFAPMEEMTEKEAIDNINSYITAAKAMTELGIKPESVIDWLKNKKDLGLQSIALDAISDTDNITDDVLAEYRAANADFEEADHPRDKGGKFTGDGSGEGGGDEDSSETKQSVGKNPIKPGIDSPAIGAVIMNVPFSEKDEAKALGAKWNPDIKKWYIPDSIHNEKFQKWVKTEVESNFKTEKSESPQVPEKDVPDVKFNNGDFKAVKQTEKAYLVSDKNGVEFWVPKSKITKDGNINKNILNVNYEVAQIQQENKAKNDFLKQNGVKFKPDWESDKAYGVDITVDFYDVEITKKVRVFIPKFAIMSNGNAQFDVVDKNIGKAFEQFGERKYGGYSRISGLEGYYEPEGFKQKYDNVSAIENSNDDVEDASDADILTVLDDEIYVIKEK